MNLATLEEWGLKKGIEIIGAADFTHPEWYKEIKAELEEAEPGLYKRKSSDSPIRFVLTSEISCVYTRNGSGRRVHLVLVAPSFVVVEKITAELAKRGNIKADGRPIIGMDVRDLVKIAIDADARTLVIPAHVWTPWFGMYGSKSGFDSIADCFGEMLEYVPAIETGLSSDPEMNWKMSELDTKCIVSFSDAHSAANIGREATIVDLEEKSFSALSKAFHVPFPTESDKNKIVMTVEFFPEEGMYHWDGHREHNIRWSPEETKLHDSICPVCNRAVTVGVMNRVERIADRPTGYTDKRRPPFRRMVPLAEIIGEALGIGKLSKTVTKEYEALLQQAGSEFSILLDTPLEQLAQLTSERIVEGIRRVRNGELEITPGYDGVYGTVHVFTDDEKKKKISRKQSTLL